MTTTNRKITADLAGCWLDGNQGWHNHYRVVELAVGYGLPLTAEDKAALAGYVEDRENGIDTEEAGERFEAVLGQGGLVDKATDHLESLAPSGFHFEWDMGELSLVSCEAIEGHDPSDCI